MEVRSESCGAFERAAYAAFSLALLLSTNTLYFRLEGWDVRFCLCVLALAAAITVGYWIHMRIPGEVIARCVLWILAVMSVYALVALSSGDRGSGGTILFFASLAFLPCMVAVLVLKGRLNALFSAFSTVTVVLAAVSLVLWVSGPMLRALPSTGFIANMWNGQGVLTYSEGWYGLQFVTQQADVLGARIVRNTSLFVEAPMYSFALSVALLFECLGREQMRRVHALVLSAAILSTVSTTGMICVAGCMAGRYLLRAIEDDNARAARMLVLVVVALVAGSIAWMLFMEKMGTSSGSTRLDDFQAGFEAWMQSPLLGNGFDSYEEVKASMSAFRASNQGFSNSPMQVLAYGGIAFMLPVVACFAGFLRRTPVRVKLLGLFFLYLWTITMVTYLPMTAFVLSLGIVRFLVPEGGRTVQVEADTCVATGGARIGVVR